MSVLDQVKRVLQQEGHDLRCVYSLWRSGSREVPGGARCCGPSPLLAPGLKCGLRS